MIKSIGCIVSKAAQKLITSRHQFISPLPLPLFRRHRRRRRRCRRWQHQQRKSWNELGLGLDGLELGLSSKHLRPRTLELHGLTFLKSPHAFTKAQQIWDRRKLYLTRCKCLKSQKGFMESLKARLWSRKYFSSELEAQNYFARSSSKLRRGETP